jgi:hypothetical protein
MDGPAPERLMALLRAQRVEAMRRDRLTRGSPEWLAATARLDELNDRIMRLGASGSLRHEPVGDDLDLELDSRPVDDSRFRSIVVDTVRQAVGIASHPWRARRMVGRLTPGDLCPARTQALVRATQATLRALYPNATVSGVRTHSMTSLPGLDTLTLRVDRDGRSA